MTEFLNINNTSRKFKEKQDLYLKEVQDYFNSTKENHYSGSENEIEAIDVIESIGALREFMIGNVIKYVLRFGKKGGFNKKDLFKAIQYLIWISILTEHPSNHPDYDFFKKKEKTSVIHKASPLHAFIPVDYTENMKHSEQISSSKYEKHDFNEFEDLD